MFRQNQRGHGCFNRYGNSTLFISPPGFPRIFICKGNLVMMTPNQCQERIWRDIKWWAWDGSGRLPGVELQRMYLQELQCKGKWGLFLAREQILKGVFLSKGYYSGKLVLMGGSSSNQSKGVMQGLMWSLYLLTWEHWVGVWYVHYFCFSNYYSWW